MLAAADGHPNARIAASLGICEDTARKWRHRWCVAPGVSSLGDAKRSGRRPVFTAVQVAQVKAMACTPPDDSGVAAVAVVVPGAGRQAITGGICASISPSTVRRWLSEDALKPWQYRSWIFITDPDFEAKAQRVLDLYDRMWDGKPLGGNDYVISADEKTSIQARCRCHPTLPPGKSRTMRVNHDYHRRGAVAYLAAYDVHRAQVFGRCEDTTGIVPFARLVEQVMTTRVSQLRGGCRAGQFVVAVFAGIGLSCVNARNSCCDKGSAELGEHVFEGDVVLVRVPGLIGAAAGEVVGVVAVQRVPDDDEAVDAEAQWHGALHRALQPVAGLADAEQLFAAGDGDLDRPAVGVAGDHGLGVTGGVGGEDRQDLFSYRARGRGRCGLGCCRTRRTRSNR